ncbi:redox-regulated ATPase YchF [Candidatus Gracilibacteria bacterium]|nr:redox-regulated ATPase YchF [Candidatus Gracilibacteria bacterium]
MQIGIVGLPNVGKSTLFNALTKTQNAEAANYPFCTIDPNVGIVTVPDKRMKEIIKVVNPKKEIPTAIEFVDIAGLVEGASKGEGLGNKFLSHIRECDAIGQVVRIFENSNITHVNNKIDPKADIEIIETELIMADLQTVAKVKERLKKETKSGKKDAIAKFELVEKLEKHLLEGKRAIKMEMDEEQILDLKDLHLLTMKPLLYIANVLEEDVATFDSQKVKKDLGLDENDEIVPISAKLEEDLIEMSDDEAKEFLEEMGLEAGGKENLIRSAYKTLGLETFFTAGAKEVRAWTMKKGSTAPQAAGRIHTDFEKNFICADVVFWKDLVECSGEVGAKEKGLLNMQGKDYIVKDGDVCHFKFGR